MNNLRKFATEADYSAATLNYPAVSWVVSGDTVHFDKTSPVPPVVNTKVKLAFTSDSCAAEKDWYVCTSTHILNYVNSITVNDTPLQPTGSGARITMDANTSYLTEYDLKENVTNVEEQFNIEAAMGCESAPLKYDLLFPAQVTAIYSLSENSISKLIFESTIPIDFGGSFSSNMPEIYVPDSAVNTYKSASYWSGVSSHIHPISDYNGSIPIN